MEHRSIFEATWFRLSVGLAGIAIVVLGMHFGLPMLTSDSAVVAQEPDPVPTVTAEEFHSDPPGGFPNVTPIPVMSEVVVVDDAGASGASGASGAGSSTAVFIYTTIDTATTTRPSGVVHRTTTDQYSYSLDGSDYLKFRDGRVVFLPSEVSISSVSRVFSCADDCGMPPVYALLKSSGERVLVDSNGRVYDPDSRYSASAFPFLSQIYPQDTDAVGLLVFFN